MGTSFVRIGTPGSSNVAYYLDESEATVGTSRGLLVSEDEDRTLLTFTNLGSVRILIGGAAVTASAYDFFVDPGEWKQRRTVDSCDAAHYAVTSSSTATLAIGEILTERD